MVFADGRRLVQVLTNLLVNAGDTLKGVAQPRVRVRIEVGEDSMVVTVEDNGPGVAPALSSRLFEPFFTTKGAQAGTGLGLALSREYITRMEGSLTYAASELGGSAFVIRLRTSHTSSLNHISSTELAAPRG